jgi:hypothetical protein
MLELETRSLNILTQARALLADPDRWCKGYARQDSTGASKELNDVIMRAPLAPDTAFSTMGAINRFADRMSPEMAYISLVLGMFCPLQEPGDDGVDRYNDHPAIKHEHILSLLDAAIDYISRKAGP